MSIINLLGISFCVIVCILIPILVIVKYRSCHKVDFKYLLLGILYYFVMRVLFYPILYLIVKDNSLILKIAMDILYLGVFSLVLKMYFYNRYLLSKPQYLSNVLSLGFGEGLAEIVLTILPVILNQFLLAVTIHFGDVYDYFKGAYSIEAIETIVSNLNNIDIFYYGWVSLIVISLIILHMYISYNIKSFEYRNWIFIVCFYVNYLLIPIYSYAVSLILLCVLDALAIQSIKLCKLNSNR